MAHGHSRNYTTLTDATVIGSLRRFLRENWCGNGGDTYANQQGKLAPHSSDLSLQRCPSFVAGYL